MKIRERDAMNIPMPQSQRLSGAVPTDRKGAAAPKRAYASSGDGIDVGTQNGLLASVQAAGAGDRASRVEQLRQLVQSGQYQVDTKALSESIIGSALHGY
ncbi:MAG TPA: flagellar biosynthesis anti-sigma factor FlgM [Bryobacteraceae bacterium]